jgi:hypothetical protein
MVRLVLRDGPLPVEVRQLAHTAVPALEDLAACV